MHSLSMVVSRGSMPRDREVPMKRSRRCWSARNGLEADEVAARRGEALSLGPRVGRRGEKSGFAGSERLGAEAVQLELEQADLVLGATSAILGDARGLLRRRQHLLEGADVVHRPLE